MTNSPTPSPTPSKNQDAPVNGRFIVERFDGGVRITSAPRRLLRHYWPNLIGSLIVVASGIFFWFKPAMYRVAATWPMLAAGLFLCGIYLLVSTLRQARTTTVVIAGRDGLTVNVHGIFRSSHWHATRNRIHDVALNGYQTAVATVDGKESPLPIRAARPEMLRLVKILRDELGIRVAATPEPRLPCNTRIVHENGEETIRIVAPPRTKANAWAFGIILFLWIAISAVCCIRIAQPNPCPISQHEEIIGFVTLMGILGGLFGLTLLLLWNAMKYPARFEVTANKLIAVWPWFRGRHRNSWTRDQIEAVTPSRMGVVVWPNTKRPYPVPIYFEGTPDEIAWIVAAIRGRMGLPT